MRPVAVSLSWLTTLFSAFAFVLPVTSVLVPKGVVPVLLVTAGLAGLIVWRARWRPWPLDPPIAAVLALLVVWCVIASFWGFDVGASLNLAARIATIFAAGLLLFAIVRVLDEDQRNAIGRWLVGGIAIGLLVMVIEAAFDFPLLGLVKEAEGRVYRFVWLNRGATALAMLCWPATAFLWRGGLGRLSLALPLALAIVLSFLISGAALAGLMVGALTALVAQLQRKLGRALLVVMTLLALVGTPIAVKEFHARGWHKAEWLSPSAQHRIEIWNFTVDLILEKPLTGWGFDVSREISRREIISTETGRTIMPLHPHNGELQILLELGAIGGAIAFVLMWLLIKRLDALPSPVSRNFATALVATTLTIASISFGLWQNQWLAMMISAALMIPLTTGKAEKQALEIAAEAERTPS